MKFKHLLLFTAPLVAGFCVIVSPTWAATFARSEADVKIYEFSHDPEDVFTLTDTKTTAIANSGLVNANATANADFTVEPFFLPTIAKNNSLSQVNGNGNSYFGFAESIAQIIGYNFKVKEREEFSLKFDALINLETKIDEPEFETASASAEISFQLYDTSNPTNWIFLGGFPIFQSLKSPEQGNHLNFSPIYRGGYSQTFDRDISLTLLEVKKTQAIVKAPESSSTLALLFFSAIAFGYKVKNKAFVSKPKFTRQLE